jgi:hypothetical protein
MFARTKHEGDMHRRPCAYFRVIAGAALLALVSPACDGDDSATSTTDSAVTVAATVEPTVAPPSTIGAPVSYPGQATYVSGTIEDFNLEEGTVTDEDNGTSRSRDGTVSYTMVANDPRVSGTLTGTWNSDRWGVYQDGALVQWGDVVLTNDDGTWEGSFAGAYASDYGGDLLTRWTVGTGAYEGLTFFFWLDTPDGSSSGPWYGLIYPGEPPPNVQLATPSGG